MPTAEHVCLFCNIARERIHIGNDNAYAIRDGFPVTHLHSLVIPKRHMPDYFGLTRDELLVIDELLRLLREEDPHPGHCCRRL
jgi:diadenosine tetraphosphate (Ap4A) HIT family hydrolase